jgi:hypothetical protein
MTVIEVRDIEILGIVTFGSKETLAVGPTGPAGQDGIIGVDGKSAYQIWLDEGNTGDEQDFLDSLVGADGADSTVPGPQGEQGDPGPNEVSTSTLTDITGILAGDGTNIKQAVAAIDYMPAYDLETDFAEWAAGDFIVGDKRYTSTEGPTNFFVYDYYICTDDHTGTTGPADGDSDKWIKIISITNEARLDSVTGIVVSDGDGGVTAAAQSDIEAILTGEVTTHTHPHTVQIKVIADDVTFATGDNQFIWTVPAQYNGFYIVLIKATCTTVSSSGNPTVTVYNATDAAYISDTAYSIPASGYVSTAGSIIALNSQLATDDRIAIHGTVAGTGAKGIGVQFYLSTELPS